MLVSLLLARKDGHFASTASFRNSYDRAQWYVGRGIIAANCIFSICR